MAHDRSTVRWPFMTGAEQDQVDQALIDLRRTYGVRADKKDFIRAAVRRAVADLDVIAAELRTPSAVPPA